MQAKRTLSIEQLVAYTGEPPATLEEWRALGLIGAPHQTGFEPEDIERAQVLRLLLRRGATLDAIADGMRSGRFERWLRPFLEASRAGEDPPRFTLAEAAAEVGLDEQLARRLWRLMAIRDAEPLLDADDLAAMRTCKTAIEAGFPEQALLQLVRVYADSLERAAEAAWRLYHLYVHEQLRAAGMGESEARATETLQLQGLGPLVEPAILYFHRKGQQRMALEDVVVHLAEELGLHRSGETPGEMRAAILFVDLASFTPLAEAMGDLKAAEVLERFGALVRESAARWTGRVAKQIGDAFLLVFPEPRSAVRSALDIDQLAAREPSFPAVRSGLHWGSLLYRDGDYVGTTVNVAARVAAVAERHQVIVTDSARKEIGTLDGVDFALRGVQRLKGVAREMELYEARAAGAVEAERTVDPVCGMEIGRSEVAARLLLGGRERVFCSQECLRRFVAAPEKYAGQS